MNTSTTKDTNLATTAPLTGPLPLAIPVTRHTRIPLHLVVSSHQAHAGLARATTVHPSTGHTSYDLLPNGEGIILWSTPCSGWWDPTADHVGTILFDTNDVLWRLDRGDAVISAVVICPPFSFADVLAHVRALFGEPLAAAGQTH